MRYSPDGGSGARRRRCFMSCYEAAALAKSRVHVAAARTGKMLFRKTNTQLLYLAIQDTVKAKLSLYLRKDYGKKQEGVVG